MRDHSGPVPHPRLPGDLWDGFELFRDVAERWPVAASRHTHDDGFVAVRVDTLRGPDGDRFDRSVLEHPGAVGILALDEADRVLLVQQYRHAPAQRMVEIPAGIRDVAAEPPEVTAARELAEEGQVVAREWRRLLTAVASPGISDERWEVYLARGLDPAPGGYQARYEEADMTALWVPLDRAVDAVVDGRVTDAMTGLALLGCAFVRQRGDFGRLPLVEVAVR